WRGVVYERLSHLDRALTEYRQAVERAPDDADCRLALGGLLLRERQPAGAGEPFEARPARTPDDRGALTGRAGGAIPGGERRRRGRPPRPGPGTRGFLGPGPVPPGEGGPPAGRSGPGRIVAAGGRPAVAVRRRGALPVRPGPAGRRRGSRGGPRDRSGRPASD